MKKIIISDTSCLIALERINRLTILKEVFSEITITPEVKSEYGKELPEWFKINQADDETVKLRLEKILDSGEASSIALASELKNCLLIIDEKKGRAIAKEFHIETIGTLKIFLLAKQKGLIVSVKQMIDELRNSGFRFSEGIVDALLNEAGE